MKKRNIVSILVYVVIIAIALFWILDLFGGAAEVSYAQAVRLIREEKVDSFYVSEDVLYLQLKESYNGQNELTAPMAQLDAFREELGAEIDRQYAEGILSDYNYYATARRLYPACAGRGSAAASAVVHSHESCQCPQRSQQFRQGTHRAGSAR